MNLFRCDWKVLTAEIRSFSDAKIALSSAKVPGRVLVDVGVSDVNILHRTGERSLPRGPPDYIGLVLKFGLEWRIKNDCYVYI